MRKILSLLIILVLASSFVLAQKGIHEPGTGIENPELKEAGQGTGQGLENGEAPEPTLIGAQEQTRERERLQTGLENALTHVTNERAREVLQRNLERFMEKYQARLERKMQNVTIESVDEETGEATIAAKEPVRFFGFIKGTATKRFTMDKNGNINERAPWYKFLYSEEE